MSIDFVSLSSDCKVHITFMSNIHEDVTVIVFLNAQDSSKAPVILDRLLEVLNTPSEAVQRAVSDCLPPLMPAQKVRSLLF